MSTTGQYIAFLYNNTMFNSSSYGQIWTQNSISNTNLFSSISVSSTGQYQIATTSSNIVYSTDYGMSWTSTTISSATTNNWISSETSSVGQWAYVVNNTNLYVCYQGSNSQQGKNKGDYMYYSGNLYNNWVVGSQNIILGANAGFTGQGANAVAIGAQAGNASQGSNAVSIGLQAGGQNQGANSVAIGYSSGNNSQRDNAIAIGNQAGGQNQGQNSIAIGNLACVVNQGQNAVAIGNNAGNLGQGNYSIAIGNNAAGSRNQPANSIILNARSDSLDASNNGFYVNPIRINTSSISANPLYWNSSSSEVFGGASVNTSDYRIKENVQTLDESVVIDQLNPVTYFNTLFDKQDIGVIAHELQEVYPFLVNGEKDGENYQTVNYNGLIGILINEIKQLKPRLEKLEKMVDDK